MKLFEPFSLGPLTLPNRLVMAPLTRNRASDGNVPHELNARYYRQRASAGLLIAEATQVTPKGQGYPRTPGIHSDEQVAGWKEVTRAVHDAGGRIFLQLWHVGRISHPSYHGGEKPVAPSAIQPSGEGMSASGEQVPFPTPRALETSEVPKVARQYRHGAEQAQAAGFDGVEVHGANGYLIDQFLRSGSNYRTDRYGGSVENRARFLLEVTDAVADVWGADRVGVRLAPSSGMNDMSDDDPMQTFGHAAQALSEREIAYLHLASAGSELRAGGNTEGTFARIRDAFDGPIMVNGGYERSSAEDTLQSDYAQLVAFGRLFLANPDLPERLADDSAPLNKPDSATFYGGGAKGYVDYPTLDEIEDASVAA